MHQSGRYISQKRQILDMIVRKYCTNSRRCGCSSGLQISSRIPVGGVPGVPQCVRAQKGELAAGYYQVADLLDLHGQAQAVEDGPIPLIDHSPCPNFQGGFEALVAIFLNGAGETLVSLRLPLHCTMCILSSMFSFQPNKLRHISKVAS